MQDRFKVGDKLVFRVHFSDVCEMLGTSFYDVLTSVYKIIGTEVRCYLMKSDDSRGRVWKIRKSRIDRLGTKAVFTDSGVRVADGECERKFEWQGFRLVPKPDAKREKRHSTDLLDEQLYPWVSGSVDASERLLQNRAKEYIEEHIKGDAAKRKELADAFVKDVERMKKNTTATMMTFYRLYKYDGSDWVGFRDESAADDIDINKLEGGER